MKNAGEIEPLPYINILIFRPPFVPDISNFWGRPPCLPSFSGYEKKWADTEVRLYIPILFE